MGKGNGFYYINPSQVTNGYTCKVGQGRRESGPTCRPAPALYCCASLSTFSMEGCKYDIFVSLGLSIGVQGERGKGTVNSERLINPLRFRFAIFFCIFGPL